MNTSNITNYKPKDFAELLGISVKTLQRWDREGILKANRTPTDRQLFMPEYLQKIKKTICKTRSHFCDSFVMPEESL